LRKIQKGEIKKMYSATTGLVKVRLRLRLRKSECCGKRERGLRSEVRGGRLRLRIKSEELRFKRKEGGGIKE
jgi:hypothetical protein